MGLGVCLYLCKGPEVCRHHVFEQLKKAGYQSSVWGAAHDQTRHVRVVSKAFSSVPGAGLHQLARTAFFLEGCLLNICQQTTGLCPETTRNRSIPEG